MIRSRDEYRYYLQADRVASGKSARTPFWARFAGALSHDHLGEFQGRLRELEYSINCKRGVFSSVQRYHLRRKFRDLSIRLGFTIPLNVIGPGLSIAHRGPIVINEGAKIGANCRLHVGVSIGTEAGYAAKSPTVGDNCYIGPGAKLFGDISVADGTVVGANAVVNKSIEEPNTAVAGVPATKISEIDPSDYVIDAARLIDSGVSLAGLVGLPAKAVNAMIDRSE